MDVAAEAVVEIIAPPRTPAASRGAATEAADETAPTFSDLIDATAETQEDGSTSDGATRAKNGRKSAPTGEEANTNATGQIAPTTIAPPASAPATTLIDAMSAIAAANQAPVQPTSDAPVQPSDAESKTDGAAKAVATPAVPASMPTMPGEAERAGPQPVANAQPQPHPAAAPVSQHAAPDQQQAAPVIEAATPASAEQAAVAAATALAPANAAPIAPKAMPAKPADAKNASAEPTIANTAAPDAPAPAAKETPPPPAQSFALALKAANARDAGLQAAADGADLGAAQATSSAADAALSLPTNAAAPALDAAAASAARVRVSIPAAQVAQEIIRRFDGDTSSFEMRLDPPELGRVEIRLEVSRDHRVTATVAADNPQALADLVRHARELEQTLQSAGLTLSENGLSFDLRQGGERNSAKEAGGDPAGASAAGEAEGVLQEAPVAARPIGYERWRGVRVDIMI